MCRTNVTPMQIKISNQPDSGTLAGNSTLDIRLFADPVQSASPLATAT